MTLKAARLGKHLLSLGWFLNWLFHRSAVSRTQEGHQQSRPQMITWQEYPGLPGLPSRKPLRISSHSYFMYQETFSFKSHNTHCLGKHRHGVLK